MNHFAAVVAPADFGRVVGVNDLAEPVTIGIEDLDVPHVFVCPLPLSDS